METKSDFDRSPRYAYSLPATRAARSWVFGWAGAYTTVKTVGDIKDTPEFDENAFNLVGFGAGWARDSSSSRRTSNGSPITADQTSRCGFRRRSRWWAVWSTAAWGSEPESIDGEWFDKPFYALRAGVDIPLGPVGVDINANYRFMDTGVFEDVDSEDFDSITFGAIVRFGL